MFRKEEIAISEWSPEQVAICSERQKMILECADQMLAPGGVMVYSTCTFSPDEDERMIAWFLSRHPDYLLEDWADFLPKDCGLESGRIDFLETATATGSDPEAPALQSRRADDPANQVLNIEKTLRLWPHKLKGEGHFAARLRKTSSPCAEKKSETAKKKKSIDITGYLDFAEQFIVSTPENGMKPNGIYSITAQLNRSGNYQYFGDELYLVPAEMNSLKGLKLMRAGLHLGTRKKNRFEPAHALAMAFAPKDVRQSTNCDYETAIRYLHGETIPCPDTFRSWTLVCYDGVSLGWGKAQNGMLKNHYPKGLRIP